MKKLIVPLVLLTCAACSTQTFHMNGKLAVDPDKEKHQTFFIGGIGQEEELDAAKVCGGLEKVAKVETEQTFVDGLLTSITFGIYTPRSARVYCSS